jgi:hypothetical protein
MLNDRDHYEAYYADKLWNLIPAVYRAVDTDQLDSNGPLRELVNRIGAQAAILRRSIDRLWEDQSIESCDDWVIPYIADLLATNLVKSLDARGQRIDVAKTIYYRRRKGTLAVLEEIAANITGWDARVVEFFRRLGRTRHNLDPAIETPAQSSDQPGQTLATGNGATTIFSFALGNTPVEPGSVAVFVAGTQVGADNNSGAIFGLGLSGTVNYTSGAVMITFTTAPAPGAAVAVFYQYPVGGDRSVQLAEGLVGALTNTQMGGWADLRNVYGAALIDRELSATVRLAGFPHMAFDEFFHTADLRRGVGQTGWHNIPRLGVFLWRLQSFGVDLTMPVESATCPGQFTFDPNGRQIPLFAASTRGYGDGWTSPAEWQLPTPITQSLLDGALGANPKYPLYSSIDPLDGLVTSNALGVQQGSGGIFDLIPTTDVTADAAVPTAAAYYIDAPRGRLVTRNPKYTGALRVTYHYGFSSTIGAGPYDRRVSGYKPISSTAPVIGGGNTLAAPLSALNGSGVVTIGDFLTYNAVANVGNAAQPIQDVSVGADNKKRPLIRLPAPAPAVSEWTFTGGDSAHPGNLKLDGLWISGGDIVLRGSFDRVSIVCCTLDPGNAGATAGTYAKAADGRDLIPCRLWVEGAVRSLAIDRSIVGPIQTRAGGEIETLTITNSIVQAVGPDPAISISIGLANLSRCTILGPANLHRLEASECILDDVVTVINTQDGCVRFSAWAAGSVIPRQYESVMIAAQAPLFTSVDFGQPAYAQTTESVDSAIISGAPDATISAGAQDGSEMGAFARDKNPIKQRSILIKYQEYMPLGLVPVIIHAT